MFKYRHLRRNSIFYFYPSRNSTPLTVYGIQANIARQPILSACKR